MKFGKQFEFYKIPEWSEFYFDYNGIKTVLKFIDIRRGKKKQLKKLKVIKAKLRRLSFHNIKNNINDNKNLINNEDEISTKANKAKESDNDNNNDNDEEKLNPKFSQTFDNEIITNEKKPFLTDEKVIKTTMKNILNTTSLYLSLSFLTNNNAVTIAETNKSI